MTETTKKKKLIEIHKKIKELYNVLGHGRFENFTDEINLTEMYKDIGSPGEVEFKKFIKDIQEYDKSYEIEYFAESFYCYLMETGIFKFEEDE